MKGFFKKMGACVLAGLLGASAFAFVGCGGGEYANTTTISVHYFNGGLGSDWINEVIADFEETFANVSFEEGKTGVHVALTPDKEFNELATSMATGAESADLIYTAESDIVSLLNTQGIIYDATEIVTEKVYDENGELKLNAAGDGFEIQTSSMYDRMLPYAQTAYNLDGTKLDNNVVDGISVNVIPYEDTLAGIIIDYDLYEELCNKYGIADRMTGYKFEGDAVAMPGTWDEFFDLMNRIRDGESHSAGGYSGFMYCVDYYTGAFENAVIADVDGTDEGVTDKTQYSGIRMYDTYDGVYDFDGDGTKETTITTDNAYMLTQTRGYEAMTEVAARLFSSSSFGNHYDNGVTNNPTYSTAQMNYIMSKTSQTAPRILAILEGDWWENEARQNFDSMGAINEEDGYGKRTFRMMPMPHMTDDEVEAGKTYKVGGFSNIYPLILNAKTLTGNAAKEKVAKLFVQFQHSQSQLRTFTKWSGSVRPYMYTVTDDIKNQMTPFAQSVLEIQMEDRKADGKIEIVRRNQLTYDDEVRLTSSAIDFSSKYDNYALGNGHVIANMLTLRKFSVSWTDDQVADVVEKYVQGMLSIRGKNSAN